MKIITLLMIVVLQQFALSQWEPVNNGLHNSNLTCIAISGKNIVVGSDDWCYISTDDGDSWFHNNTQYQSMKEISAITANGNDLLSAGYNIVRISTDNGNFWFETKKSINTGSANIPTLLVKDSNIIAGTSRGIYSSTNYGNSWMHSDTGLPDKGYIYIFSLAMNKTTIFAGTIKGVFCSIDNGNTWVQKDSILKGITILSLVTSGNTIFAGTWAEGIFISTDEGISWSQADTVLKKTTVFSLSTNGNIIFAGTDSGLYTYDNNLKSLTKKNSGLENDSIISFAFKDNKIFAISSSKKIFRSTDGGNQWIMKKSGLTAIDIERIFSKDNLLITSSMVRWNISGVPEVFYSTNNGDSWDKISANFQSKPVTSIVSDSNYIYISAYGQGIYRSSDNGRSWSKNDTGMTLKSVTNMAYIRKMLMVLDGYQGLCFSTDHGISWNPFKIKWNGGEISYLNSFRNVFWAGTEKGGIYSTDYNFDKWYFRGSDIFKTSVNSIESTGSCILASSDGSGVIQSTDGCDTWTIQHALSFGSYVFAVTGNCIFAGNMSWGEIFLSKDNSISWSKINNGIDFERINTISVHGNYVYVGTLRCGIFRAKLSDFGISEVNDSSSENFRSSIFPNPATDFIDIILNEQRQANFENLSICNIFSEIVLSLPVLSNSLIQRIDISKLIPGIYLLKIGNQIQKFIKA